MKTKKDYVNMQKSFYNSYNDVNSFKNNVVGYYDSQQLYPYEKWLLNINGDYENKLFDDTSELVALDYGCGMGRMVERMNKLFKRVDGVDIGDNLIRFCKETYPNSNFWVTDGTNCATAPLEHYDFIFSTICMQHICSYDVRMDIWKSIEKCLKPNGKFCFQMMMFETESDMHMHMNEYHKKNGSFPKYSRWRENHFDATSTNSGHDVYILRGDYYMIIEDVNSIFKNCKIYEDSSSNYFKKVYITGEKTKSANTEDC
jgi:2-polyprenyl-3-methyl-5-hydroxy-6-metoxy-1,4-benzoquinol methylase